MNQIEAKFEFVSYARPTVKLPTRADKGSCGYDFYLPEDIRLSPFKPVLVWTDIKVKLPEGYYLEISPRSSVGLKGVIIPNSPGKVDSSYYNNPDNEGNIGIILLNVTMNPIEFKMGERIAQGTIKQYYVAKNDIVLKKERVSGFGSTGKN